MTRRRRGSRVSAKLGRSAVAAVVLVLVTVSATAPTRLTTSTTERTVLRVAITQGIDHLNPFLATFASSTDLMRLMYEFLTAYDAQDQEPVPALAESWTFSADNLTWTFTIRDGMRWSDGQPITATDVAFTFTQMMTDEDARTANGNFVANFESVTAPDDRTVVIQTIRPQATMLALDVPIVPEHIWKDVADIGDFANDRFPVVGSGPFVLTEYVPDEFITLAANENFWRGRAMVDELQFIYYKNNDAAVQGLRSGEVDLIGNLVSGGITPAQFDSLADDPRMTRNSAPGHRFTELVFNSGATTSTGEPIGTGHPALRDLRVRRAIAYAIDPKTLVDRIQGGYAEPGSGYIPPVYEDYHWSPPPDQERKFDLSTANQILDTAGYLRGTDGIRRGPDGRELDFELIGRSERTQDAALGAFAKGWLAELGIRVDVSLISGNQLDERTTNGSYDMALSGWGIAHDPDFILSIQTCAQRPGPGGTGGTTNAFFCDTEFDLLYARQLSEFDPGRRAEIVKRMQQRLYDQVPSIILFYQNALEVYRSDRFVSFQVQPDPGGVITGQNGYWGYYRAVPVDGPWGSPNDPNTGLAAAGIGTLVLLGAAGAFLLWRRRATVGDRE